MNNSAEIVPKHKLTYSVAEAAEVLGISESRMRQLARSAGFPTVHIGRRLLVSIKGLECWVEEQAQKGWYNR